MTVRHHIEECRQSNATSRTVIDVRSQSLSKEFGLVVRQKREELKLSQEAFAYQCGVHRTYMTHIERGTKMPSILVVAKIANGLNIEVSDLFLALERGGFKAAQVMNEAEFDPIR